ncbi:dynein axonemal heavy chain 7 [Halictus rubicundus]|uniref:dynein axonemal heavy chain 7 n=1 Tax=Halictus rubicundus TaxID=77578 RepID=UPI004035CA3A
MVGLVVKPELPKLDVDLSSDEDINRYYNYISNGVDTFHTTQIHADVLENILNLVPFGLRDQFYHCTEDLLFEIKDTYTTNIKKAILEFALRDPLQEELQEEADAHLLSSLVGQVRERIAALQDTLYLINPCMKMTLDQWIHKFRDFRLVNIGKIVEHEGSWDLGEFETVLSRQIDKGRIVLKSSWYSGIQDIFLVRNRKGLVPSPLQKRKFKRFFGCIAKIMEGQLLSLCRNSLKDFTNLIVRGQVNPAQFCKNQFDRNE